MPWMRDQGVETERPYSSRMKEDKGGGETGKGLQTYKDAWDDGERSDVVRDLVPVRR